MLDANHRRGSNGRQSTFARACAACLVFIAVMGCNDGQMVTIGPESVPAAGTWLVDENYIFWGCAGRGCIPSLTDPPLVGADSPNADYLDDDELVVGIRLNDDYVALPHAILDWHEIVNLTGAAVSYCPLTGSAIHVDGNRQFGVSGLLYRSNLIMYDRGTGSYWPQMFLRSAAGKERGEELVLDRMVETAWSTWKSLFPETKVLSDQTGYGRDYERYPYGSYKVDRRVYFPIGEFDGRIHPKARVLGIITAEETKAYEIDKFGAFALFSDEVGGEQFLIVGSATHNFAVAFQTDREFEVSQVDVQGGRVVVKDRGTGTEWNILGEAVAGPVVGLRLDVGNSFISYWFALATFYPGVSLWQGLSP